MVSTEQLEQFRWLWQGYLAGTLSVDQHGELMEMLADKAYAKELSALLLSIDPKALQDSPANTLSREEMHGLWKAIENKTGQPLIEPEAPHLNKDGGRRPVFSLQQRLRKRILGVAAVILLALGVGIIYHWQQNLNRSQNMVSRNNIQSGAVQTVGAQQLVTYTNPYLKLPDGSVVRLNKNASLTVDMAAFNKQGNRTVRLKGEAYFKVVHNSKSPFIVVSSGVQTIDIGTAFNINNKDGKVQVTVIEGEVQLKNKDKNLRHLTASQQLTLNLKTQQVELVSAVNAEKVIAWTGSSLDFDGITLDSTIRIINQRFDVNVQVAPLVKGSKIKASFTSHDSVENILEVLATISGATMEKTDKGNIKIIKNSTK